MRTIIFILLMIVYSLPLFSQKKVDEALAKLFENYPQEKLILNLTKENYIAGETIFFKAYTLNAYQPSIFSTNVYVELYDNKKNLIDKLMVPLYKGTGEGSIMLPASISEGIYFLRAYTSWMQNFPPEFEYLKPVKIFNPYSSQKLVTRIQPLSGAVFVESGILREGVASKIVVRLKNNENLPEHWKATIFETSSSEPMSSESSLNPQLALLHLIPEGDKRYVVRVQVNDRDSLELPLPQVKSDGDVFLLSNQGTRIDYNLQFGNANKTGEGYKIIGTIHDEQVYKAVVKKSSGNISGSIKTDAFPNGILRMTVFDENENPVAERLSFIDIQHLKMVVPEVQKDTLDFSAKGKNVWQVPVDTASWFSYAVQVQDESVRRNDDFLSSIFLTSDIRSDIWNPAWYFENIDHKKAEALDALLITENWKRFRWEDILAGKFPTIRYVPEKYLSYVATVTRKNKVEPLKEVNLIFRDSDGFTQLMVTPVDSNGRFMMERLLFLDSVKVYYQLNLKKSFARNIHIQFDSLHRHSPLRAGLPSTNWQLATRLQRDSLPAELKNAVAAINSYRTFTEKTKVLKEVVINYQRKTPTQQLDEKLSSGLFKSMNEMIFDFVNDPQFSAASYTNVLEWLVGRVPGFRLENRNGDLIPYMRNSQSAVYVDEMLTDPSFIGSISVQDVAMIKVIRGPFMGSSFGSEGAIAIYTDRGGLRRIDYPGLPFAILHGYQKTALLFSPDYSDERLKDVEDRREIFLRNHALVPNENSVNRLSFYNNDSAKKFRIIVTGFSSEGLPVYLNTFIRPRSN